jgi:very-short-patch-repair endonuclease
MARDRDRLRQGELESRGWTFVRIWSTDYFRDLDTKFARVVAAHQAAPDVRQLNTAPLSKPTIKAQ